MDGILLNRDVLWKSIKIMDPPKKTKIVKLLNYGSFNDKQRSHPV